MVRSLGINPSADHASLIEYAVIEVEDVNAASAFVRTRLPHFTERALNNYILFTDLSDPEYNSFTIEFIGNQMVISPGKTGIGKFPSSQSLLDDDAFQQVVGSLPATTYNSLMYAGWNWPYNLYSILFPVEGQGGMEERLGALGIEPDALVAAPLAIGLTILDGNTLTLDTAQLPKGQAPRPQIVNPDFLRFVPADVDIVVHGTNLTALYQSTAATVNDIYSRNRSLNGGSQRNIVSEFEGLVSQFGIDIHNDLLSWATGDYTIFARADVLPIAEAAGRGRIDINDRYDFGIIIQATNPVASQTFVDRLGRTLLRTAPLEVIISGDQVNGINVTKLSATIPVSGSESITIDLMMGTVGDIFFIATPRMVQSVTARSASLADLSEYQDYSRHFLPQPTSVWYMNSEGFIINAFANPVSVAVSDLALIGQAAGDLYDTYICEIQGTCVPTPTPTPTPTPDPADTLQPLQTVLNEIRASSITSTVTNDGVTLIRLTLTVNYGASG